EGRLVNEEESVQKGRVAVIGPEIKTILFSGLPAIGQDIRIDGITFQVVGIFEAKPQEGDSSVNKTVYIPASSMTYLRDTFYVDGIWFDYEGMQYEKIEQSVRELMASTHQFRPDDRRAVFVFNGMKR